MQREMMGAPRLGDIAKGSREKELNTKSLV